ncbi:MAG: hypothetical protein KF721_09735 [Ignavibacteriaceae bacterium]|nr:hypothetical protein [Ignavibacteriaceae bacterium]
MFNSLLNNYSDITQMIYTIIGALVGGGIVNYILDKIKQKRERTLLRKLFINEVKINLDVLDSEYVKKNPSLPHKTFSSFYNSNSNGLSQFYSDHMFSEKINNYYGKLELLKYYDKDLELADKYNSDGRPEVSQALYKKVGELKSIVRTELIENAIGIIGNN